MKKLLSMIITALTLSTNLMAQSQQGIEAIDRSWEQFLRNEDVKVVPQGWSNGMAEYHFKYTIPDNGQPIRLADLEQLATAFSQNAVNSSAIYAYDHNMGEPPISSVTFSRKDNFFDGITGTYGLDDNDNFRIVNFVVDGELTSFGLIWHEVKFNDRHGNPFRTIDGRFFKFFDGIWKMEKFDYRVYHASLGRQSVSVSQDSKVRNDMLLSQIKSLGKLYVENKQKGDEPTCDAIIYALKKTCDTYQGRLSDQQYSEIHEEIWATFLKDENNTERINVIGSAVEALVNCAETPLWGQFIEKEDMSDENIFVKPDNHRVLKLDYNLPKDRPQVHVALIGTASTNSSSVTIKRLYPRQTAYNVDVTDGKFTYHGFFNKDQLLEIEDEKGHKMVIIADSIPTEINLLKQTLQGSQQNERFADCQRRLNALQPEFHKYATYVRGYGEPYWTVVDYEGYNRLIDDAHALQLQMMKENKDNMIPVWYLTQNFFMMTADELALFMQRSLPYADHVALQPVRHYYEGLQKRAIGKQFSNIAAVDTKGNHHLLSEYIGQGKYAILCFWDMGSRSDMKTLKELQRNYENANLNVVCVTMDNYRESWANYVRKRDLRMVHLQPADINDHTGYYDRWECEIFKTYGINTSLPETIIFGPDGRIVAHGLCGESLKAFVSQLKELKSK